MQPQTEAVLTITEGRIRIIDMSRNFPTEKFIQWAGYHGVKLEPVQRAPCG